MVAEAQQKKDKELFMANAVRVILARTKSPSRDIMMAYLVKRSSSEDRKEQYCKFNESESFQKLYEGKNVVFINLCLRSDVKRWTETIAARKIGGEHYFLDSDLSEMFMSQNGIEGFPHYMIINREGKPVNLRAVSPANVNELSKQLDRLLQP